MLFPFLGEGHRMLVVGLVVEMVLSLPISTHCFVVLHAMDVFPYLHLEHDTAVQNQNC